MSEDTPPRVRTAWSDPDHTRLVYDLEDRLNERRAVRLRGTGQADPWATRTEADDDADDLAETLFAWGWTVWADSPGHAECKGWTYDTRDRLFVCSCGVPLWVVEPLVPS